MLKTIEQKLRDKERQEIIRADQESARSIQNFVKKAILPIKEELKARESMQPYAQYTLDNKYLNFEKSIHDAYNMIDNNLEFNGFSNVISAYNELANYIVSIAKYNSLSQSLKIPIEEKMNKLNNYLNSLISRARVGTNYDLNDLENISSNIDNRLYKTIDINQNLSKIVNLEQIKNELIDDANTLITSMQAIGKPLRKKNRYPDNISEWLKNLKKILTEVNKNNLSSKVYQESFRNLKNDFDQINEDFSYAYKTKLQSVRPFLPSQPMKGLPVPPPPQRQQPQPQGPQPQGPKPLPTQYQKDVFTGLMNKPESDNINDPEQKDVSAGEIISQAFEPLSQRQEENAEDKLNEIKEEKEEKEKEDLNRVLNPRNISNKKSDILGLNDIKTLSKTNKFTNDQINKMSYNEMKSISNEDKDIFIKHRAMKELNKKDKKDRKLSDFQRYVEEYYDVWDEQERDKKEQYEEGLYGDEANEALEESNYDFYKNQLLDKYPLSGELKENFIEILAKQLKSENPKMKLTEAIEQVKDDAKRGSIDLYDLYYSYYVDNNPRLLNLLEKKEKKKKQSKIEEEEEEEEPERKKKGKESKKTSKWIEYAKAYAKKNNISYAEAIKQAGPSFKKSKK